MAKEQIFIVEDDKQYLDLYLEILQSDYECFCFNGLHDAISALNQYSPKTVILDLNLPDGNGFEFCKELSKRSVDQNLDIIFVSGDTSPETKIAAYEAGASDYITKPFALKELCYKVKTSVLRKRQDDDYKRELKDSQFIINTTMEQASQYSLVMNFFKDLSHCKSEEQLAHAFFKTMSQFKLKASLKLSLPTLTFFQHNGHDVSPIEKEIFELLKDRGRIVPFSNRMIINDKHVSFILKNPPVEENELGQVRDYVAAIIEGLESKLIDIYSQSGMAKAIDELNENIVSLKERINEHRRIIDSVMNNMSIQVAGSYHSLEMTEQQELFFNNLIVNSTERLSRADEHIAEVLNELEVVKGHMVSVKAAVDEVGPAQNSDTENIELF